ncbi:MAG: hypothetical protein HKM86_01620, partial [Deltaproteobacteria bacterium]|nr:hypothetical protein [Deltaproteobacteria bacterium]
MRMLSLLSMGAVLLTMVANPVTAEEKTVVGMVVRLDVADRTLTVQDGMGVMWNYKVDRDAGIALEDIKEGDRVSVTIGRATPPNMITAADRLRKGDRVKKIPF